MGAGGTSSSSDNLLIYSIQRTYIINIVPTSNAFALTCNQRIDVPVIEPIAYVQTVVYNQPRTVVPCVELKKAVGTLEGVNLVFETNEGVTVLPVKIDSGRDEPMKNTYSDERFVLALPRGTTGIKSCKVLLSENGDTIQHNFTFGIMPPPYNYDNALFGVITSDVLELDGRVDALESKRLYVKQAPLKSYPGFFQIFGTNDQNGILGWEFTFTNTGNMLTLTSGDLGSHESNTILNGVDIAESKKLTLTYDKGSSIFTLYDITEGVTGAILSQRYLASGLGRTTGAPQRLHLIIDGSEQNVLNIGSGFVSHI